MTPIGPVGLGGDSVANHMIRRSYPFSVLPTQRRQTFTTPVISLVAPMVMFANGATVESNKLYEAAIEWGDVNAGVSFPIGPGPCVGADYPSSFDCTVGILNGGVSNPENLDSTGFMGIEMFSQAINVPTNTPVQASIQLKWMLKDPSKFIFSVYLGNSVPGKHTNITIPNSVAAGAGGDLVRGGHKLRIGYDPHNSVTTAYIDDKLVASETMYGITPFANNNFDLAYGILLFNGAQTGVCDIRAIWGGVEICNYDTHLLGSGII